MGSVYNPKYERLDILSPAPDIILGDFLAFVGFCSIKVTRSGAGNSKIFAFLSNLG